MIRRVADLVATIVGILFLVFGIVGGSAKVSGDQLGVDCGSALSPATFGGSPGVAGAITDAFATVGCKDVIESKVAETRTMIIFGIILTIGGAVVAAVPARKVLAAHASSIDVDAATSGLTDKLERLARLHATGALSDEEYGQAKRQALTT